MRARKPKTVREKTIREYNKRLVKLKAKDAETPLPSLLTLVNDWSFLDLGRATGLHKASVSNIMSGKRMPNLISLVKLARALGYWNSAGTFEKFAMSILKLYQDRHGIGADGLALPPENQVQ